MIFMGLYKINMKDMILKYVPVLLVHTGLHLCIKINGRN